MDILKKNVIAVMIFDNNQNLGTLLIAPRVKHAFIRI